MAIFILKQLEVSFEIKVGPLVNILVHQVLHLLELLTMHLFDLYKFHLALFLHLL